MTDDADDFYTDENGQARLPDPLSPKENPRGHQWGRGKPQDQGYARCRWCKCRENTKESAEECPNAVLSADGTQWQIKALP